MSSTSAIWWETAQQKYGLISVVFEVLRCAPRDAALEPTQCAYEDAPGSAAATYTTARSRTNAKGPFLAVAARLRSGTSGSAARVLRRVAPRRFGRRRLTHLDARRHRVGAATLCPLRARARRSALKAEPPKRGPKELMKQGGESESNLMMHRDAVSKFVVHGVQRRPLGNRWCRRWSSDWMWAFLQQARSSNQSSILPLRSLSGVPVQSHSKGSGSPLKRSSSSHAR